MNSNNRVVRVVAAIIVDNGKYFATQRGYGEWKGYWEFPGGKIEPGEKPEEAIRREIREELEAEIAVNAKLLTVEYDYPSFHLSMDCFLAEKRGDRMKLLEHEDAKWLSVDELDNVEWLPADKIIISELKKKSNGGKNE